jgi:hypothetical protein
VTILFDIHLGGDPQAHAHEQARAAPRARPVQSKLLREDTAKMDPVDLAAVRRAVAEGFATGRTTAEIVRELRKRASEVQAS